MDDATIEAKNVADLVFNEEQASYLAGVAAAKSTKTNTVGFVGGVDIPLIHKFQAGYEQGVKDTDPKIKVISQYLTQTAEEGGFSSPDKGKTAAEGQIEKKADVVYAAAGLSGQGVIERRRRQQGVGDRRRLRPVQAGSPREVQGLHPDFGHEGCRQGGVQPREVGRGRQARRPVSSGAI